MRAPRLFLAFALSVTACTAETAPPPETPLPSSSPSAAPSRPSPAVPTGFAATRGKSVDLFWEVAIGSASIERVEQAAATATERIELDFKMPFRYRPTLYVFATDETFKRGLTEQFHLTPEVADATAKTAAGIALSNWIIGLNWSAIERGNQLMAVPHELTHLMVGQFDPDHRRIPVWLNEGLARLGELSLDGMRWRAAEIRYVSASMAQTGTLIPFVRLVGQTFAVEPGSPANVAAYAQSAEAAQLVIDELGRDGLVRLLTFVSEGASFPIAYLTVTGKKDYDFESGFGDRVRALGPVPAIVSAPDAPIGSGPYLLAYGLPPLTKTALTLRSGQAVYRADTVSDAYGAVAPPRLDSLPRGEYTATAAAGNVTVTSRITVTR